MKRLLIVLLLAGCQSSNNIYQSQVERESPQAAYERFQKEFAEKINRLNAAGKGSVNVCRISNSTSLINVFYSNERGKRLVIRVYDEHIVNNVNIYADKKQTNDFLNFLTTSSNKAIKNRDLEKLSLGRFSAGKSWVELDSRYGAISGFWGDDWVDRVLTPINPQQLNGCIKYVEPHL